METLTIPQIDDFHVHLRQGSLMDLVTPTLSKGGCRLALVMPNLKPPIKTVSEALEYKTKLLELSPSTQFLMTLYLHSGLTAADIYAAKEAGIVGIKSYPKGVTTNSDSGIESYTIYYPIFAVMEKVGLILNLHGEIPSDPSSDICVLNAERLFLKHLKQLALDFPNLKIVLEHATSKEAVEMVKSLGDNVACTITIHHLHLVVDDWAGCCHNVL
jgi:dihydroorotase